MVFCQVIEASSSFNCLHFVVDTMAPNTPSIEMPALPGYAYDVTTNRYFRLPRSGDERLPFLLPGSQNVSRSSSISKRSSSNLNVKSPHPLRLSNFLRNIEIQGRTTTHAEHVVASVLALPFTQQHHNSDQIVTDFGPSWRSTRGRYCYSGFHHRNIAETEFLPTVSDRVSGGLFCLYHLGSILFYNSEYYVVKALEIHLRDCLSLACCGNLHQERVNNGIRLAAIPDHVRDDNVIFIIDESAKIKKLDGRGRGGRRLGLKTVSWIAPPAMNADERYSSTALPVTGSRSGSVCVWDPRTSQKPISFGHESFGSGGMVCCLRGKQNVLYVSRCSVSPSMPALTAWDVRMPVKYPLVTFQGHVNLYRDLRFDVWNGVLAAGSDDNCVRLWDVNRGGEPLAELKLHSFAINVKLGDLDTEGRFVGGLRVDFQFGHGFYSPTQPRFTP